MANMRFRAGDKVVRIGCIFGDEHNGMKKGDYGTVVDIVPLGVVLKEWPGVHSPISLKLVKGSSTPEGCITFSREDRRKVYV
jgi:hypothetical protein